jgi:transposase
MLGVSLATIKRYLKQRRESGHVRPKAIPGRPAHKGTALQAGLLAQLQAHPDASLATHCELWETEHGMRVSTSTMSRLIQQVGWTRKKSRWQPVNAVRRNERAFASR